MKTENNKILGIVKELLSNSLSSQASDINIKICKIDGETSIEIIDNGRGMDKATLEDIKRTLNQPFRGDMRSYYQGLVGHSSEESGLNLVGLLIDKVEVESSPEGTRILVKRNR